MQIELFEVGEGIQTHRVKPFKTQLLKWIGNKQRFAHEIASYFPSEFGALYEPFFGSGAVTATVMPAKGFGSDVFQPLAEIWMALKDDIDRVIGWYEDRWQSATHGDKVEAYEAIKASYNKQPNPADLLFLCRACYGGVVRFRKVDGYMSTPCGPHTPISPDSFAQRARLWRTRLEGVDFACESYGDAMERAKPGDVIYCDPPYSHTQAILYGAQDFSLTHLFEVIADCKARGVYVVLSIDGTKKSGDHICDLPIPPGLFEREVLVNCGRSMLKRFQMNGKSLEKYEVADRLLLTY